MSHPWWDLGLFCHPGDFSFWYIFFRVVTLYLHFHWVICIIYGKKERRIKVCKSFSDFSATARNDSSKQSYKAWQKMLLFTCNKNNTGNRGLWSPRIRDFGFPYLPRAITTFTPLYRSVCGRTVNIYWLYLEDTRCNLLDTLVRTGLGTINSFCPQQLGQEYLRLPSAAACWISIIYTEAAMAYS